MLDSDAQKKKIKKHLFFLSGLISRAEKMQNINLFKTAEKQLLNIKNKYPLFASQNQELVKILSNKIDTGLNSIGDIAGQELDVTTFAGQVISIGRTLSSAKNKYELIKIIRTSENSENLLFKDQDEKKYLVQKSVLENIDTLDALDNEMFKHEYSGIINENTNFSKNETVAEVTGNSVVNTIVDGDTDTATVEEVTMDDTSSVSLSDILGNSEMKDKDENISINILAIPKKKKIDIHVVPVKSNKEEHFTDISDTVINVDSDSAAVGLVEQVDPVVDGTKEETKVNEVAEHDKVSANVLFQDGINNIVALLEKSFPTVAGSSSFPLWEKLKDLDPMKKIRFDTVDGVVELSMNAEYFVYPERYGVEIAPAYLALHKNLKVLKNEKNIEPSNKESVVTYVERLLK